jgi:hypothetical protein
MASGIFASVPQIPVVLATDLVKAFHSDLFRSVLTFFVVLAIWGFVLFFMGRPPAGSYLGALIIGEGLVVVQALTGLLLIAGGHHPEKGLHWLYGAIVLATLPACYGITGQREVSGRMLSLYYGIACAFVVLIAGARSYSTG